MKPLRKQQLIKATLTTVAQYDVHNTAISMSRSDGEYLLEHLKLALLTVSAITTQCANAP